jgi:hypothetical protein
VATGMRNARGISRQELEIKRYLYKISIFRRRYDAKISRYIDIENHDKDIYRYKYGYP